MHELSGPKIGPEIQAIKRLKPILQSQIGCDTKSDERKADYKYLYYALPYNQPIITGFGMTIQKLEINSETLAH